MTPDEIAAERERCFDGQKQPENNYAECVWSGWFRRTLIARAEQAELRERVRELAKWKLNYLLTVDEDCWAGSEALWKVACSEVGGFLMQLAEEAGCWFDDDGNEVPLDKWRARMGGVG